MNAAEVSDPILLSRAIAEGEDINQRDDFGSTALMKAVLGGNHGMVDLLLQAGAKVDIQDMGGASALHIAARLGNIRIVEKLLLSLDTVPKPDIEGNTPYTRALKHGNTQIAKMISAKVEEILKRDSVKESVEEEKQVVDESLQVDIVSEVDEIMEEEVQIQKSDLVSDVDDTVVEEIKDTLKEIEQEEIVEVRNEENDDFQLEETEEELEDGIENDEAPIEKANVSDITLLNKEVEKQIMEVIEMTEGEREFEKSILEENKMLEKEIVEVIEMSEEEQNFASGKINERKEGEKELDIDNWNQEKYVQISNIHDKIADFISKIDNSMLNIENIQVDYFTDDYGTAIRLYGLYKKEEAERVCEILSEVKKDAICKLEK